MYDNLRKVSAGDATKEVSTKEVATRMAWDYVVGEKLYGDSTVWKPISWLILEIEQWELVLFHTDLLHFGAGYPLDYNHTGHLKHYCGHWYFSSTRLRAKEGARPARMHFVQETYDPGQHSRNPRQETFLAPLFRYHLQP